MNFSPISALTARFAHKCSAPVSSDVSPNTPQMPLGISLSYMLPTVGLEPMPEVVSDSPHLVEIQRSEMSHSSRCCSVAQCTNSLALRDASAIVVISPFFSMANPATGLPVAAMPSTTFCVQMGSIPMTTHAATLGLDPVPIMVRKCRSRSSPNCSRP